MPSKPIEEHKLISNSFTNVGTVDWRVSPELLVLEFFREFFFKKLDEGGKASPLLPTEEMPQNYRTALYMLRGRKSRNSDTYAPAYPSLAKYGWLRRQSPHLIARLLFGPVAQYFFDNRIEIDSEEYKGFLEIVTDALGGAKSSDGNRDILALMCMGNGELISRESRETARTKLQAIIARAKPIDKFIVKGEEDDQLSSRIYTDWLYLCELATNMSRMQWLNLLMVYLQFALPIWALAQMEITVALQNGIMKIIESSNSDCIEVANEVKESIKLRGNGLFQASRVSGRIIEDKISIYIKRRIELTETLNRLAKVDSLIADPRLILTVERQSQGCLRLEDLLLRIKEKAGYLSTGSGNYKSELTRWCEKFQDWRVPSASGVGKNFRYFLSILTGDAEKDEREGYLLHSKNRGRLGIEFRVMPGQSLLKLITSLAAKKEGDNTARAELPLRDIIEHFKEYGVDFNLATNIREDLINKLRTLGLLIGSPDAGTSVTVINPYRIR